MRVLVVACRLSLPVLARRPLARTFVNLNGPLDPRNVLTATVDPTSSGYRETAVKKFYARPSSGLLPSPGFGW
jgi:hypothetical protein